MDIVLNLPGLHNASPNALSVIAIAREIGGHEQHIVMGRYFAGVGRSPPAPAVKFRDCGAGGRYMD
jgi:UDP-N-acetylmuramate-alanine ligase